MKYILRTLWLIGYMLVFVLACTCFFIMIFIYPLIGALYFIKTGNCENIPFTPDDLPDFINKKYVGLLNNL